MLFFLLLVVAYSLMFLIIFLLFIAANPFTFEYSRWNRHAAQIFFFFHLFAQRSFGNADDAWKIDTKHFINIIRFNEEEEIKTWNDRIEMRDTRGRREMKNYLQQQTRWKKKKKKKHDSEDARSQRNPDLHQRKRRRRRRRNQTGFTTRCWFGRKRTTFLHSRLRFRLCSTTKMQQQHQQQPHKNWLSTNAMIYARIYARIYAWAYCQQLIVRSTKWSE